MQLSTNSNLQLDWVAAAQPTPIGKHRAAYLQMLDRQRALVAAEFELKKLNARHDMKVAEIKVQNESIARAEDAGDYAAAEFLTAQKKLLEVELEEMVDSVKYLGVQQADALREFNKCKELMKAACAEARIDFEELDEETYQLLMAENVRLITGRRLSAQLLEVVSGIPASFVETLSELPAEDQQTMLSQYAHLCNVLQRSQKAIANPIVDFAKYKSITAPAD